MTRLSLAYSCSKMRCRNSKSAVGEHSGVGSAEIDAASGCWHTYSKRRS